MSLHFEGILNTLGSHYTENSGKTQLYYRKIQEKLGKTDKIRPDTEKRGVFLTSSTL